MYTDQKFLRSATYANSSIGNRLRSTTEKCFEYVSKISWKRVNKNSLSWWYVLKTCWSCLEDILARRLENVLVRSLEDVLKTFWRSLENILKNILKTSWRCLKDVFVRRLQDVLKTSWRCLEDVLKTSWRRMTKTNILVLIKTSSEDVWARQIDSSWRRMFAGLAFHNSYERF